jgi:hypothetical protein
MSERHRAALGAEFDRVSGQGAVELLESWTNPATGRPTAIADERLRTLTRELLPVAIEGDSVQYAINRTPNGWVIELINNRGVIKRGDQPAVVDPNGGVRVTLKARVKFARAKAWRSGRVWSEPDRLGLELGPGAVEFIEYWEHPEPGKE